jgi:uncharacterized protein (TIGR00369 family)
MDESIQGYDDVRTALREPRRDLRNEHRSDNPVEEKKMTTASSLVDIPEPGSTGKQGKFPPPIAELLGFRLVSAGGGRATIEIDVDERYSNPMGTLHGGVLCDIADAAMGIAYSTTLAPEQSFTTIELKINFLRPVWKARLRAEGRVVNAGKLVGLIECDVFDEQRRLIAHASSTCMTLTGARAASRAVPVELGKYQKQL